jgi:hypothetical protein
MFASPRLAQRMIAAGWFVVVRKGGRETLY